MTVDSLKSKTPYFLADFEHSRIEYQIRKILTLGAPIGIGLTFQRMIFYSVNAHMLFLDKSYVVIFTVFTNISSLLLLPAAALAQIHSISASTVGRRKGFHVGTAFLLLTYTPILLLIFFFGTDVLKFYGMSDAVLLSAPLLPEILTLAIGVSAFLMLINAQLRNFGVSTKTQTIINFSLLFSYGGTAFLYSPEKLSTTLLLEAYFASYLTSCFILFLYSAYISRRVAI
ncbi:hypothetical protein ACIPL1_24335 [Pseudomonas sp. NPDC090202]|uniref:hypothetical protein n=1 Tax=unclassified Pseudomonas TaxID=196821 RepID=UPI0038067F9E